MRITRRQSIILGAATMGAAAFGGTGSAETALTGDSYPTGNGEVVIHPVEHASFVMTTPGLTIYNDPVGGAAKYEGLPPPALILIGHEHADHLDVPTLQALVGDDTRLLTSAAVHAKLPPALRDKATAIAPGEGTTVNDLRIEAIPAYNTTPDRLAYHPRARGDNGYILGIGDRRVYIAGDSEDTPEMRALKDIDVAFLPMNLPYTMTVEQAAEAVAAFQPTLVYPYHYKGSDIDAFEARVADSGAATKVVRGAWYPAG